MRVEGSNVTLSSRERLTRILNHEPVDRAPIWLLFPHHPLGCYVDVYGLECYRPVVEAAERMADGFDRRGLDSGFCGTATTELRSSTETVVESGQTISRRTIAWGEFAWTHETKRGSEGTRIKPYLSDISQLEELLQIPWVPARPNLDTFRRETAEFGDGGLMMVDCGDALGRLSNLCSVADFAMWSLLERDALVRFLDEVHRRLLDFYTYLLDNGVGPVFFLVGAEFAGPPVVSPAHFEELSGKYVKDLVDLIRSYGMKSIVHYHGNLKRVLPAMAKICPDGLHTIEAPPIGDCTLSEAREALGEGIVLIGNIQYDDLARLPEAEIRQMVKDCMDETRGRSFILSPTAGPYEAHIGPQMQHNYVAFMEAGVEYGRVRR